MQTTCRPHADYRQDTLQADYRQIAGTLQAVQARYRQIAGTLQAVQARYRQTTVALQHTRCSCSPSWQHHQSASHGPHPHCQGAAPGQRMAPDAGHSESQQCVSPLSRECHRSRAQSQSDQTATQLLGRPACSAVPIVHLLNNHCVRQRQAKFGDGQ